MHGEFEHNSLAFEFLAAYHVYEDIKEFYQIEMKRRNQHVKLRDELVKFVKDECRKMNDMLKTAFQIHNDREFDLVLKYPCCRYQY